MLVLVRNIDLLFQFDNAIKGKNRSIFALAISLPRQTVPIQFHGSYCNAAVKKTRAQPASSISRTPLGL